MAFIFSKLSATDPVVANIASSPLDGTAAMAGVGTEEEDRATECSFERRSSSFFSEELSKSDILSLDSLR